MPMYKASAAAICDYTVSADDTEQAIDFIFDMIKEDFSDADRYEVGNIEQD